MSLPRRVHIVPDSSRDSPRHERGSLGLKLVGVLASLLQVAAGPVHRDPVDYVDRNGYGDLAPKEAGDVRLVTEDLRLGLVEDAAEGNYFRIKSDYTVVNLGPRREVSLGVPMEWQASNKEERQVLLERPPAKWKAYDAAHVRITVAGKKVACEPRTERALDDSPYARHGPVVLGWCVAKVSLPHGERIKVSMETTSFVRDVAGSAVQQIGYWLAPAGGWAGKVDRLHIEVDLGAYAPFGKVVSPAGAVVEGQFVRWDLRDASPGASDAVRIQFPGDWYDLPEGYGWVSATGQASVALPGGAPIVALTDGKPETTWCGSLPAGLVPVVLEATFPGFRPPPRMRCAVKDVSLAIQWLDDKDWAKQGPAVTALRVSSCARPEDGLSIDWARVSEGQWPVRGRLDRGQLAELPLSEGVLEGSPDCVRFEITRTDPRALGQFCLGELNPRVYCRDDSIKRPSLREVRLREFRKLPKR